jgi:hypothetical protein
LGIEIHQLMFAELICSADCPSGKRFT